MSTIILAIFVLIATLFVEFYSHQNKKYKYKFKGTIVQLSCSGICIMKIKYNPKDLYPDASLSEDFFSLKFQREETYVIGEQLDIVSNSKKKKHFKICCSWEPTIIFLLGIIFIVFLLLLG